jgi:hypothetical protein
MKRELRITAFHSLSVLLVALLSLQLGFAQVSSSTNYRLETDSINFGGGLSSSTSYVQESTFGELGTGTSSSATYQLRAGYQQMQEVYLSISQPDDVDLSPDIGGLTGGTSNGSTTFTVITDSPAGYSVTIEAPTSPAMQSSSSTIADHTTVTSRNFSTAGGARFGYSVLSPDAATTFFNNGSVCGSVGSNVIQECWRGLTTTPFTILEGDGSNHPAGTDTTLYFRVGIPAGAGVATGLYTATTTLTALPL